VLGCLLGSARRRRLAGRAVGRLVPGAGRGGDGVGRRQDARLDRRLPGPQGGAGGALLRRTLGRPGGTGPDVAARPPAQGPAAVRRLPCRRRNRLAVRRPPARRLVSAPAMSGAAPRPRTSLRREVLILLPAAVLLLVVLSTFTLFTYRGAIALA